MCGTYHQVDSSLILSNYHFHITATMSDVDAKSPPSELPTYSESSAGAPAERITHSYDLKDKKGRPWVTLQVYSATASTPSQLPRMVQGEPIQGKLILDTEEDKHIKSISVSVSPFPPP